VKDDPLGATETATVMPVERNGRSLDMYERLCASPS